MTERSPRPAVEEETVARAEMSARPHGITTVAWMGASIETEDADPVVAAAARAELEEWRSSEAVAYRDLVLPSPQEVLLLSLGAWRDEAPELPEAGVPVALAARTGYGIKATDWGLSVAPAARGYWRRRAPSARDDGWCRIVAFRRGQFRMHAWAGQWTRIESGRYFAASIWVAVNGWWVDADEAGARVSRLDNDDRAVQEALDQLIVRPAISRSPVRWMARP